MNNRIWLLCGIASPALYLIAVVLGGLLTPGYSHVAQPVSDLIATGAPAKSLLDPLFAVYNLVTLGFGLALYQQARGNPQPRGGLAGTLAALSLVAEGFFGFVTLFFPEDAGGLGTAISSTGMLHIVFAGLSSLTSMLTLLLAGFWFHRSPNLRGYSLYSFISVAAVFVTGGLAALSVANGSPIGGLLERLTIGGFLQWLLVIAWVLYSSEMPVAAPSR
jgi:Protein of unknown function (DUF998)